jgi:hypothetical protein
MCLVVELYNFCLSVTDVPNSRDQITITCNVSCTPGLTIVARPKIRLAVRNLFVYKRYSKRPVRNINVYLLYRVQIGTGAHIASCQMGTGWSVSLTVQFLLEPR